MARKFVIVSDSASDMPAEYFAEHEVECCNLGFFMDDTLYLGEDGESIDTKDFYDRVRKGAKPVSHQVNVEAAKNHIEKYVKEGKDVYVVGFSSGLSGTCNSFFVAAKELSEVYPERKILVTDTLCASMGQGLILDYAVRKADSGASIEETYEYTESIKQNICHFFTVDDLFHLKRGGRVSATTAIIGSMLSIKPILHVNEEGKLINIGKAMGRKKSLRALFDKLNDMKTFEDGEPIFISHGDCISDVNYLADMIRATYPNNPIYINYIGPVIGTHAGPGTVALFFKGKHR